MSNYYDNAVVLSGSGRRLRATMDMYIPDRLIADLAARDDSGPPSAIQILLPVFKKPTGEPDTSGHDLEIDIDLKNIKVGVLLRVPAVGNPEEPLDLSRPRPEGQEATTADQGQADDSMPEEGRPSERRAEPGPPGFPVAMAEAAHDSTADTVVFSQSSQSEQSQNGNSDLTSLECSPDANVQSQMEH